MTADSPITAAHRHYLRCAETFSVATDAARHDQEKIARARDALTKAQQAYWEAIDAEAK